MVELRGPSSREAWHDHGQRPGDGGDQERTCRDRGREMQTGRGVQLPADVTERLASLTPEQELDELASQPQITAKVA